MLAKMLYLACAYSLLIVPFAAYGQTEVQTGDGGRILGAIVDGDAHLEHQIPNQIGKNSSSISVSVDNGTRRVQGDTSADGKFEIVDDPDNGITVKMTEVYGNDDAEKLMENHPELYMHLKAIPKQVGDNVIQVSFEITEKVTADDPDQLKEKNAEAYRLYEKYSNTGMADLVRRAGRAELMDMDPGKMRGLKIPPPKAEGPGAPRAVPPVIAGEKAKDTETEGDKTEDGKTEKSDDGEPEAKRVDSDNGSGSSRR